MDNYNNPEDFGFFLLLRVSFYRCRNLIFKTPMESYLTLSIFFRCNFPDKRAFRNHSRTKQYLISATGLVSLLAGLSTYYSVSLWSLLPYSATVLALYVGFYYFIPFLYEYRDLPWTSEIFNPDHGLAL